MRTMPEENVAVISRRFFHVGLACLAVSLAVFLLMAFRPIDVDSELSLSPDQPKAAVPPPAPRDLQPLLVKMAGVRLIRPAQALAAVLDSGAAKLMLKKLKLQGIVEMGEEPVAYVQVEGAGTVAAKVGDTVLDFVVERIDPGKVTLSFQGVIVELVH